jgi:Predicted transcriptional regulators
MNQLLNNVALNLTKIRKKMNWSLDEVAEQTGVSKSMLGQIERGESNPTILTMEKIVSGLRVPFSVLISTPRDETIVVKKSELVPVKDNIYKGNIFPFFPFEDDLDFEIYVIELEPGGCYETGSHGEDTLEFAVINQGSLTLLLGNEITKVDCGDGIRFQTNLPHKYVNNGEEKLSMTLVFTWK